MGYELFAQRDSLSKELSESITMMGKYGADYAKKECDYKVELAQAALKLRDDGMAVTMINTVIHGTGKVPKLRMERDIAEVMYKTAIEKIQSVKLQLKLVEAQIDREWSQAKRI